MEVFGRPVVSEDCHFVVMMWLSPSVVMMAGERPLQVRLHADVRGFKSAQRELGITRLLDEPEPIDLAE